MTDLKLVRLESKELTVSASRVCVMRIMRFDL